MDKWLVVTTYPYDTDRWDWFDTKDAADAQAREHYDVWKDCEGVDVYVLHVTGTQIMSADGLVAHVMEDM